MKKRIGIGMILIFFLTLIVGRQFLTNHRDSFVIIKSNTELELPVTVEIISLDQVEESIILYDSEKITNETRQIEMSLISQRNYLMKLSIGQKEQIINEYIEAATNKFQVTINIKKTDNEALEVQTIVKTLLGRQEKEFTF